MVARKRSGKPDTEAHQLQLLLAGGDPATAKGVAVWRPVQEKV